MAESIVFTDIDGEGVEQQLALPARFVVCRRCAGHGMHLNPSIGEHAYTPEEFRESFDEEEAHEYFTRGGRYDVSCGECSGKRVVLAVDRKACKQNAALSATLRQYDEQQRDRADYEALCASERRYGA